MPKEIPSSNLVQAYLKKLKWSCNIVTAETRFDWKGASRRANLEGATIKRVVVSRKKTPAGSINL
jgi:hypothetical protein